MKKLTYITLSVVAGLLLMFTSCKNIDFGDLNQPEYAVTQTEPANLLAGATVSYGAIAGRLYSTNYAFYVQWMTQGIYDDEQRYANFQGAWAAYYTGPLANIQEVINRLQDTAYANSPEFTAVNGAAQNVYANALIMKAIVFKRITDIFGAIPMSQALDPNNITPAYDKQQQVYDQLIDMLRTARDTMNEALPGSKGDVFYGGDVAKMKKLANSLLMEVALQLSEVNPTKAEQVFMEAYNDAAGYITDAADEAWYRFNANAGVVNPWSRLRYRDYFVSLQFWTAVQGIDTLQDALGNNANVTSNRTFDMRTYVYINALQDRYGNTIYGEDYFALIHSGSGFAQAWSELFSNPELPMPEMTAAYTWLNIAEAAARGWVTDITADQALTNAIVASYDSYEMYWQIKEKRGIPTAYWEDYAPVYAAARVNDMNNVGALQVIGEEKWFALYPIAWKAWAEWRRTGWPHLTPLPAEVSYNGGVIPTRYRYPAEEINLNNANYLQGVQDLTPPEDQNTSHVWWDVN